MAKWPAHVLENKRIFSRLFLSKYLNLLSMQNGSLDNKQALMQE